MLKFDNNCLKHNFMHNNFSIRYVLISVMKTSEELNYRLKSKLQSRENYSLLNYEIRIKQIENQNFIVPWQMVNVKKKEILVE